MLPELILPLSLKTNNLSLLKEQLAFAPASKSKRPAFTNQKIPKLERTGLWVGDFQTACVQVGKCPLDWETAKRREGVVYEGKDREGEEGLWG